MAISFDATAATPTTTPATTSVTWNHTCTGANGILFVSAFNGSGLANSMSATYNGVTMTAVNVGAGTLTNGYVQMFYLVAPATGSNAVVVNCGTPDILGGSSASYAGVSQSSPIDSNNTGTNASIASFTLSTSVVASNCWAIMSAEDSGSLSAGTGTTGRQPNTPNGCFLGDSNGIVGTGSQSLQATHSGNAAWAGVIASFKPFGAVVATSSPTSLLMGV